MNSDDTDRQKDQWKAKILNAARTRNLPKSSECDLSAKIEGRVLDVEEPGRLTFLIDSSLKFGTF